MFSIIIASKTNPNSTTNLSKLLQLHLLNAFVFFYTFWIGVRVLFADDVWWTMKPWMEACKKARVDPMWYEAASKHTLNQDIADTLSLVGNIEPKDRRALPPGTYQKLKNWKKCSYHCVTININRFVIIVINYLFIFSQVSNLTRIRNWNIEKNVVKCVTII